MLKDMVPGLVGRLVVGLVIPILSQVLQALRERAEKTPNPWDDIGVGVFEAAIEFLKQEFA